MEERFPMKASSVDAASPYATPIAGRPVLVVESDPDQRRRVTTQLASWGYTPLAAGTAEEALELLARAGRVAFSVVAIRLPGMSGIELLRRAGELSASGPVIMVADNGHSSQIVEAIQAGADDFLRRPYTAEDLEQVIRGVAGRPRREPTSPALPGGEDNGDRVQRELAMLTSAQMREILSVIEQAARADVTVLVCGETGVGKELVARAIHAHSPRRRPRGGCQPVPRGSLLPAQRHQHSGAATARAPRGDSRPRRLLRAPVLAAVQLPRARGVAGGDVGLHAVRVAGQHPRARELHHADDSAPGFRAATRADGAHAGGAAAAAGARAVRGHQGPLAQGDLSPRRARGRARSDLPRARAVPVEPREDRQDAQDQLSSAALQDQGHGAEAGLGRELSRL